MLETAKIFYNLKSILQVYSLRDRKEQNVKAKSDKELGLCSETYIP